MLEYEHKPLIHALASAALPPISSAYASGAVVGACATLAGLKDTLTTLNALAWALHFAGALTDMLDSDMYTLVMALAGFMDSKLSERTVGQGGPASPAHPCQMVSAKEDVDPDVPPKILVDLPDMCVVHKPPGWEVDCADVGTGLWLSSYLQHRYTSVEAPLVYFAEHQFGMVHRLDRVSSGLLLVGKTCLGFAALRWQLNTGRVQREYVIVTHGWVNPTLRLIDARVLHVHAQGYLESRVTEQGKPSQTCLTTLGHYTLRSQKDQKLSVVVVQIRTGRRHQIRTHFAHVGHPVVADGRYVSRELFVRDKLWCTRNFLHRYRLSFQDLSGRTREATAPLPEDLRTAIGHLVPVGLLSEAALAEWRHGSCPAPWSSYAGLLSYDGV